MGHPLPAVQLILAAADHWTSNHVSSPDNFFLFYDSYFAQLAFAAWYLPSLGRLDQARWALQSYNHHLSSGSSRLSVALSGYLISWAALSLLVNQAYAITGEAVGMIRALLRRDSGSAARALRALAVVESAIEVLAPQSSGPLAHPSPAGATNGSGTTRGSAGSGPAVGSGSGSDDSRGDSVASTATVLAVLSLMAHAPRRELLCDEEAPTITPAPSPPMAAASIDGNTTSVSATVADAYTAPAPSPLATFPPRSPPLSSTTLMTSSRRHEGDSECRRRTALYLRLLRYSMPDMYLVLMMEVQLRTRQWHAAATLLRMWEARRVVEEANSGGFQCELYRLRAELAAHELAQWRQRQLPSGADPTQLRSMLSAVLCDYAGAVELSTNAHMPVLAAKALLSLLLWLQRMGALPAWTVDSAVDTRFALRSMDELCVQPWCALLLTNHLCPWLSRHVPREARQRLTTLNPSATADPLPSPLLPQRWCVWDTVQPSLGQDEVLRAHSAVATVCTLLSLVEASISSATATSSPTTPPVAVDEAAVAEATTSALLSEVPSSELDPQLLPSFIPAAATKDVQSTVPSTPSPDVLVHSISALPLRSAQAAPTQGCSVAASCMMPSTPSYQQPQHQQQGCLMSAAPVAAPRSPAFSVPPPSAFPPLPLLPAAAPIAVPVDAAPIVMTAIHQDDAASAPNLGSSLQRHCGELQLTFEDLELLVSLDDATDGFLVSPDDATD